MAETADNVDVWMYSFYPNDTRAIWQSWTVEKGTPYETVCKNIVESHGISESCTIDLRLCTKSFTVAIKPKPVEYEIVVQGK